MPNSGLRVFLSVGLAATLLACAQAPEARIPASTAVTAAVHSAALQELFTVRERAQRLVLWRDTAHAGPVFARLHATPTHAPVAPVSSTRAGGTLPYDSVSLTGLERLFRDHPDGWKAFFAQQPESPGIIELGNVWLDAGGTQASVLVGRSCGERCAMAWRLVAQTAGEPPGAWRVTAVHPVPLPPEAAHARFVAAPSLLHAELASFTILDARGRWAYGRGHLPGAVPVDWADYRDGWGRTGKLPDNLDALARRLGALGVDSDRPVLVYGAAADGWGEEGRIAWMLRYLGHPEVLLLDGGFAAWQRTGGRISRQSVVPAAAQFAANPQPQLRVSGDEVAAASTPATVVLDTRSRAEWNGSYRYLPKRRGHIPNAVHLHWSDLLAADGTLDRSAAASARLAALGLTDSTTVLAYCVGGVRSAFVTLALRELGIRDVRNYDGSWYEWSANPDRRIASPAAAP